jgi:hypothetical protein
MRLIQARVKPTYPEHAPSLQIAGSEQGNGESEPSVAGRVAQVTTDVDCEQALHPKDIDQSRERGRLLTTTRIIQEESRIRLAPRFQHPH